MSEQLRTIAYVLLSGGIDSSTALTYAANQLGVKNVRCVSVDYGQRHRREIEHAKKIADYYGRPHHILDLSSIIPKTTLTDPSREIPSVSYDELPHGISPTYTPFRNGLMLSALTSHIAGIIKEADDCEGMMSDVQHDAIIFFGAHSEDAARDAYPDCNFQFTGAMANAIYVGTYGRVKLLVPWQFNTKDEIITYGAKHGTPYHLSWSCYKGLELHCGVCPTCRARIEAFRRAGVPDPTEYQKEAA